MPSPSVLVGGVIARDEVDVETLRRLALDLLQEAQPFDMRVARFGARDQLSVEIIKRREQRRRSMALGLRYRLASGSGPPSALRLSSPVRGVRPDEIAARAARILAAWTDPRSHRRSRFRAPQLQIRRTYVDRAVLGADDRAYHAPNRTQQLVRGRIGDPSPIRGLADNSSRSPTAATRGSNFSARRPENRLVFPASPFFV